MKKETKDYLISNFALLLEIPYMMLLLILRPTKCMFLLIILPTGFIIQGLIYIFKKNVFFKFYLSIFEKTLFGLIDIVIGIYWILKIFNVI